MERDPIEMALSTDIVLDNILSHLNVEDLLDCRHVSKFWNKAASSVLRKRSAIIKNISNTKTLKKLEACMQQSRDFPFAGLIVDQPWKLSSAGAMKFFKNYGARFTRLQLGTSLEARLENQAPFLNHLPRLSILELGRSGSRLPPQLLDSAAGQKDNRILNLPSLRTLRISSGLNEDVLHQVCTAASPSLRIECLETSYRILKALKNVGKLQAVSVMKLSQDEKEDDNKLRVDELLSTQTPALTKLDFQDGRCISRKGLIRLLISSQHALKELRLVDICPSEFISECPVLPKLSKFSVEISYEYRYLFQGREGHKFPALQELQLGLYFDFNMSDDLFIVPSLKRIHLTKFLGKESIKSLARIFPNVIEIQVPHEPNDVTLRWVTDPIDIWSVRAFKKLEKLKIWNYTVQRPTNISTKVRLVNMDSFLTGIPLTICENLRKQPQQNLKDSLFNEILRDSPSLLQLKNLKELIVCVRPEDKLKELFEEPPFISMVSVWYALEMMPKLSVKFVYEHRSPSWRFGDKDRNKAVTKLKAAFKQVQPHVELEPFYQ